MKTNNPRKIRDAQEAAAGSGSLRAAGTNDGADLTPDRVSGAPAASSGALPDEASGGEADSVAMAAAEAVRAVEAAAAAAAAEVAKADDATPAASAASDDAAQAGGDDVIPAASDDAAQAGGDETVSFNSATEMLAQSRQEMKKAKAAAARQKRAREMEAFQKKVHARRVRKRIFLAIFGVIVLAAMALVLAFCANRWWIHDDAADIQGTWQIDGSNASVTFTEDSIILTDEVAYHYEIDPENKTINFNFGNLSGEGYYRFSLDRNQLSVTDGETTAAGDLMEDIGWWINAVVAQICGDQLAPAIGADSVGFTRM